MALPVPVPVEPPFEPGGTVIRFPGEGPQFPRYLPTNPAEWGFTAPDWLPNWDPEVNYTGKFQYPVWGDVYDWAKDHIASLFSRGSAPPAPTQDDVQNAANAAAGAAIKSLGGFIDHAVAQELADVNYLQSQVSADSRITDQRLGLAFERLGALEQGQAYIAQVVVPTLRAEILQAKTDAINVAAYDALANRQWAVDHILKPLTENLGKVATQAKVYTDGRVNAAEHDSHILDNAQTAARATLAGAILPALGALKDWVDDCGEPMCQTMGPKTDLGKFLKAFKIAQWTALLVTLGSLRAGGLDELLEEVAGWMGTAVNEFEDMFLDGGKSIAETIRAITP